MDLIISATLSFYQFINCRLHFKRGATKFWWLIVSLYYKDNFIMLPEALRFMKRPFAEAVEVSAFNPRPLLLTYPIPLFSIVNMLFIQSALPPNLMQMIMKN